MQLLFSLFFFNNKPDKAAKLSFMINYLKGIIRISQIKKSRKKLANEKNFDNIKVITLWLLQM